MRTELQEYGESGFQVKLQAKIFKIACIPFRPSDTIISFGELPYPYSPIIFSPPETEERFSRYIELSETDLDDSINSCKTLLRNIYFWNDIKKQFAPTQVDHLILPVDLRTYGYVLGGSVCLAANVSPYRRKNGSCDYALLPQSIRLFQY